MATIALAVCSCARHSGPAEGNSIAPIVLESCRAKMNDDLSPDVRSMVAMMATFDHMKYEIFKVSPTDFKIFTTFKQQDGYFVAWEAQVYDDGSVSLMIPETSPVQPASDLAVISKFGRKVASTFDKLKCRRAADLKKRVEKMGYTF